MIRLVMLLIGLCCLPVWAAQPNVNLMPYPSSIQFGSGSLDTTSPLRVYLPNLAPSQSHYLKQQLRNTFENVRFSESILRANIIFDVTDSTPIHPSLHQDESYQLNISPSQIRIKAANYWGLNYGLQTLRQLAYQYPNQLPSLHIDDQPRFAWRGLMIDSARHFIPINAIKRQLDGMVSAKLNVLHWHLTDDQGWRFASQHYPKLQQHAADGQYYTHKDMADIVAYAAQRGIRVVPEIDLPGHASALAVAYPELMAHPGPYKMERGWGVFKPLLDPSNPEVYTFIKHIISELAATFPDPYVHIGGDEVKPDHWRDSQAVQEYMQLHTLSSPAQLHNHFNLKVQSLLSVHNKVLMGWDEIFQPELNKSVVIQSWRGFDSLTQLTNAGHMGVLSAGFYVDQPQYTSYHYRNDPLPQKRITLEHTASMQQGQAWQFSITRLKGSPVTGHFVLSPDKRAKYLGYIVIDGRKVIEIEGLEESTQMIRFNIDTWMGPLRISLTKNQPSQSQLLVGNTPYTHQIRPLSQVPKLAPSNFASAPMDSAKTRVLGAEATIWGELVMPYNLDLRLWPRLFAIAERLWSPVNQQSETSMYQRLAKLDKFATHRLGLKHQSQHLHGLATLSGQGDIDALKRFSQLIEQAQYYTRHHVKYQNGQYHQQAPLDALVDFLPAESSYLRQWHIRLASQDKTALYAKLMAQYQLWLNDIPKLKSTFSQSSKLAEQHALLSQHQSSLELGIRVIQYCTGATQIVDLHALRAQIWQHTLRHGELILAVNHLTEAILDGCITQDEQPKQSKNVG
ncbi:family 20 glycosylhydrolase [Pseudoalteromonas sp. Of7M-16]|uniref:beta-N-acetylhexosaminidase n=1 Tax=Pseudoalteromonas sp. Of7M-16 TaxID=2917756 RepID=UPI001EF535E9|nr:family 20 glycosylhydrolase [Pseudoalteromonas sp. Of7M-16]MCG7551002.1 beta-N-acetylhexosaminidase [Pseudoalteromonas sp. Of7M-16]